MSSVIQLINLIKKKGWLSESDCMILEKNKQSNKLIKTNDNRIIKHE